MGSERGRVVGVICPAEIGRQCEFGDKCLKRGWCEYQVEIPGNFGDYRRQETGVDRFKKFLRNLRGEQPDQAQIIHFPENGQRD